MTHAIFPLNIFLMPLAKKITDSTSSASFYNFQFEVDKKNVLELKNKLNLNEKILRYLLLVRE